MPFASERVYKGKIFFVKKKCYKKCYRREEKWDENEIRKYLETTKSKNHDANGLMLANICANTIFQDEPTNNTCYSKNESNGLNGSVGVEPDGIILLHEASNYGSYWH